MVHDTSSGGPDESLEKAVTVAAHHDEVGVQFICKLDDDLAGDTQATEALAQSAP